MEIKRAGSQPSGKGPSEWFTAMTHIAIQEKKDGKVVEWMEHVTDQQYRK